MRTIGVEEELLVVDPDSRVVVARAPAVLREANGGRDGDEDRDGDGDEDEDEPTSVEPELFRHQVEVQTAPVTSLDDLASQLVTQRRLVGRAAEEAGLALAASASIPGEVD
ncbi:MAG: glutamate-cysteine ligase family protein, partial [Nocardioides sp.]